MQRASNSTSFPTTPTGEPSLKRRKTDHTPDTSAPTTPASDSNQFASKTEIAAALEAEDQRQREAAQKRASLGYGYGEYESQWVVDFSEPPTNGAEEESDCDDIWAVNGRQTYGAFKRKKSTANTPASTTKSKTIFLSEKELSSEEEGEASDESDDNRSKKRKAETNPEDDAAAMAALDRVDLSRSSYTKSKGTMAVAKSFQNGRHRDQKRGDKHPKKKNKKGKNSSIR